MSALVPAATLLNFVALGEDEAGADQVVELAGQVEAFLLGQCARKDRPFQAASAGRIEYAEGSGAATLWLDYPVAALTSVALGPDHTAPSETLVVNDQTKLVWSVGSPRLVRVDGGLFGAVDQPRFVKVTYDAGADLPSDATLAVLRVTAAIWRQRGAEDVTSERVGGYSADLAPAADSDPVWQAVVAQYRVPLV